MSRATRARIHATQYKAVLGANYEQIMLYWNIGKVIIENSAWGNKFIDNLARDIKLEFSERNGLFRTELEVYAQIHRDVPRNRNCASAACTINVVSFAVAYGQGFGQGNVSVVCG